MTHIPESPARRRTRPADAQRAEDEIPADKADTLSPEVADAQPADTPPPDAEAWAFVPRAEQPVPSDDSAGTGPLDDPGIVPQPDLRKKELVEMVVARSGVRKRDAKPAVEAALAILGEAIADGRELNLRPFGKLRITRMKKGSNGQIINARVRQPEDAEISAPDPLAPAAE